MRITARVEGARLWSIVVTSDDPYAERKKLTFAQAEGLEPLPTQLALREISQQFRAALWAELNWIFGRHQGFTTYGDEILESPWSIILEDAHVYHHHRLDDFPKKYGAVVAHVRDIVERGSWSDLLGWLEYVLKHRLCPPEFATRLNEIMADCHLAYRVIDGVVICPIGSKAEGKTIEQAFADLNESKLYGARDHLGKAGNELSAGHFAASIRESIHAVESVVRILEPDGNFGRALSKLENKAEIHSGLKTGFKSIYGFTSDQKRNSTCVT
jgi:AbiJ N-terminal domain 4